MKKTLLIALALVMCLVMSIGLLTACGPEEPPVDNRTISLDRQTLSIALDGAPVTLVATLSEGEGSFTWESSNPNVATVDANGKVTPKSQGTTTITVKCGELTPATCVVTVGGPTYAPVFEADPTGEGIVKSLKKGETYQINGTVLYNGNEVDVAVSYESSNQSIATVSQTGLITAVAVGSVEITATATYLGVSVEMVTEVAVQSSVSFTAVGEENVALTTVALGEQVTSKQLQVQLIDAGVDTTADATIAWSIAESGDQIVSLSATSGATVTVSALAVGSTQITASTTVDGQPQRVVFNVTVEKAEIIVAPQDGNYTIDLAPLTNITAITEGDTAIEFTANGSVVTIVKAGLSAGNHDVIVTANGANYEIVIISQYQQINLGAGDTKLANGNFAISFDSLTLDEGVSISAINIKVGDAWQDMISLYDATAKVLTLPKANATYGVFEYQIVTSGAKDYYGTMSLWADELNSQTISTPADLYNVLMAKPDGSFKLTSDIDFDGANVVGDIVFSGILDGQGYSIKNFVLTIFAPDYNSNLFAENAGTIKNIGFDFVVKDNRNHNSLIYTNKGTISNVFVNAVYNTEQKPWNTAPLAQVNTTGGSISNVIILLNALQEVKGSHIATVAGDINGGSTIDKVYVVANDYMVVAEANKNVPYCGADGATGYCVNYQNNNALLAEVTSLASADGWNADLWTVADDGKSISFGGTKVIEKQCDHVDADHDGICDLDCGKTDLEVVHVDENHDGACDATECTHTGMTVNHVDNNCDGTCDVTACGATGLTIEHVDTDFDGACDKCGTEVINPNTCKGHADSDSDKLCDLCGATTLKQSYFTNRAEFKQYLTDNADKYIVLLEDIDIGAIESGKNAIAGNIAFTGVLDGCGYSIKNFNINYNSGGDNGYCPYLFSSNSGTIKNINWQYSFETAYNNHNAGLIKANTGTIENCYFDVTISYSTANYNQLGLIASSNESGGVIQNCIVNVTVTDGVTFVEATAGLVSCYNKAGATIKNVNVVSDCSLAISAVAWGTATNNSIYADSDALLSAVTALAEADGWNQSIWSIDSGALYFGGEKVLPQPKNFSVTIPQGDGYTVTGESSVLEGASYSFTVTIDPAYSNSQITVKVNDQVVTAENGTYTVASVSQNLVITVEGVAKNTYAVTIPQGTGYSITGNATATHGEAYTFALELGAGYSQSTAVVKVNGTQVTLDNGSYTIAGENVTGAIEITVEGVAINIYSVTLPASPVGYTITGDSSVTHGATYTVTVVVSDGYKGTPSVKAGELEFTAGDNNTYTLANVSGNLVVTVEGISALGNYSVSGLSGTGYTVTGESQVQEGASYSFTIALETAYSNSQITVKVNDQVVTDDNGTYTVENVSQDLEITVEGVAINTYAVTIPQGTGYSISNASSSPVEHGASYSFTLTLDIAYSNSQVVVTATGGTVSNEDNVYTISNVTSATEVTISGVAINTYEVTKSVGENTAISGADSVTHGEAYTFTVSVDENYELVSVTVNGMQVTLVDGSYTIAGADVTGAITIATQAKASIIELSMVNAGTPNAFATLLRATPDGNYVLTEDLDWSGAIVGTVSGQTTTCSAPQSFSGILDGQGHTISNYCIGYSNDGNSNYASFMIGTLSGTIKNIGFDYTLSNANHTYTGLVLYNSGTIENVFVKATVNARSWSTGALAGTSTGTIKNVIVVIDGASTGTGNKLAGIVGSHQKGTITNCYAIGNGHTTTTDAYTECFSGLATPVYTLYADSDALLTEVTALAEADGWNTDIWTVDGGIKFGGSLVISATTTEPEHECESVCAECGKCLDTECTETACADKCQGHTTTEVTPETCPGHADSDSDKLCDLCGATTLKQSYFTSRAEFKKYLTDNADKYIVLLEDIDIGAIESGKNAIAGNIAFTGVLDGCGYSIKNFNINYNSGSDNGYCPYLFSSNSGTIKNINWQYSFETAYNNHNAGLIKANTGTIENCYFDVTISYSTANYNQLGLIASSNESGGVIQNCIVNVTVSDGVTFVEATAGLVSCYNKAGATIKNVNVVSDCSLAISAVAWGTATNNSIYADSDALLTEVTALAEADGWNTDIWTVDGGIKFGGSLVISATTTEPEHECESVCAECGKCLDTECTETACADKCQGHTTTEVTPETCPGHADSDSDKLCDLCGATTLKQSYFTSRAEFKKYLTDNADKYIVLLEDIDFGAIENNVNAAGKIVLTGTLDGQGYAIKNFAINYNAGSDNEYNAYLFYQNQGTIKNIRFEYSILNHNNHFAALIKENSGTIQNVYAKVTIAGSFGSDYLSIGGLAERSTGSIKNTIVDFSYASDCSITQAQHKGAIVGINGGSAVMENCYVITSTGLNAIGTDNSGKAQVTTYTNVETFTSAVTSLPESDGWNQSIWSISDGAIVFSPVASDPSGSLDE